VILYFWASARVQRKYKSVVGGEKGVGCFPVFRVASSSGGDRYFLFLYLSKRLNTPFAMFFALSLEKGFFDYVLYLAQSNYSRFCGASTRGDVFVPYKTKVVDHQKNPCLLRKHPPWYSTCDPTKKPEHFLRVWLDKSRRSWHPYKVTGVSSLGAQAAESMRVKLAESK